MLELVSLCPLSLQALRKLIFQSPFFSEEIHIRMHIVDNAE